MTNNIQDTHCPKCSQEMAHGIIWAHSKIMWLDDNTSALKKTFSGGVPISKNKNGVLKKHRSSYCEPCDLFILNEQ